MKGIFIVLVLLAVGAAWYFTPIKHHRAAPGTYFMRQPVSFTTPRGVTGWAPGQEIHEDSTAPAIPGSKTVTDGTFAAIVPEAILTQDIEDAAAMRLASTTQDRAQGDAAAQKGPVAAAQNVSQANGRQAAEADFGGMHSTRLDEPTRAVGGAGWGSYYYVETVRSTRPSTSQATQRRITIYEPHHAAAPKSVPLPVGTAR